MITMIGNFHKPYCFATPPVHGGLGTVPDVWTCAGKNAMDEVAWVFKARCNTEKKNIQQKTKQNKTQ